MEEIGLQLECPQEDVVQAVRQYVSSSGRRLVEECPLRRGLRLLRARPVPQNLLDTVGSTSRPVDPNRVPTLADLFDSYFIYYFRYQYRRALLVGPTVGRWTGILWDEKAIDCRLLRYLSTALHCRAVGYCFIENEDYSYLALSGGSDEELFSSFLADNEGRNFWSASGAAPPDEGPWVSQGFLKNRYAFIPGFYDLPYLSGQKPTFSCYRYDAFPDHYAEEGNFPFSTFRYFNFQTTPDRTRPTS